MGTLCVVPCGGEKIWDDRPDAGPTPARLVYTGAFAATCREYAKRFYPSSWCILSAKHGFLLPDDIVPGPYNATFNDPSTHPIADSDLVLQIQRRGLDQYDTIVVIAGMIYASKVVKCFPNACVRRPLSGLKGMGYMLQALKKALREGHPL